MKHNLKITFLLVFVFFAAQITGLVITSKYVHTEEHINPKTHAVVKEIVSENLPYNLERPDLNESTSFLWILSAILIGTVLLLVLIKFRSMGLWKLWFFLAVFSTMSIAFSAFIQQGIAAILAFALAVLKIYKPNAIVQNVTEVFIYGGLAAIFVPVLSITSVFLLLISISIYDIIAVRHTKHMVKLAKFQAKSNVFAGLFIPYAHGRIAAKNEEGIMRASGKSSDFLGSPKRTKEGRVAVLGGGDIGFPLLFAGVVMKNLLLANQFTSGFLKSLIVPVFATLALLYLLVKGEKDRFYPAMPYISAGCFVGYLIVLAIHQ